MIKTVIGIWRKLQNDIKMDDTDICYMDMMQVCASCYSSISEFLMAVTNSQCSEQRILYLLGCILIFLSREFYCGNKSFYHKAQIPSVKNRVLMFWMDFQFQFQFIYFKYRLNFFYFSSIILSSIFALLSNLHQEVNTILIYEFFNDSI